MLEEMSSLALLDYDLFLKTVIYVFFVSPRSAVALPKFVQAECVPCPRLKAEMKVPTILIKIYEVVFDSQYW